MLFRGIFSGAAQGAGNEKNWHRLCGMQYFMLFRGLLSGATQGAGNEKKWTPPTRNAIFHVILKCSFWSRKIKKTLFFTGKSIKKLQNLPIHPKGRKIKFLQRALFRGVTHVIMYWFFFPRKVFCERGAQNPLARTLLFGHVYNHGYHG